MFTRSHEPSVRLPSVRPSAWPPSIQASGGQRAAAPGQEEVQEAFDDEEFGDVFEKMMDDDAFVGLQLVAQVSDTSNDDEKNFFKPFWTPFSRSDVFSE